MIQHLIVADWHINKWTTRNETYRNKQPMILVDKLISLGQEKGISILDIPGDFLNLSVNRPRVLKFAYKVLEKLSEHFEIRLVFGNHDFDDKNANHDHNDCSLMINDYHGKVKYVNGQTFNEEGLILYYSDYQFTEEVKCPKCDIFIGHVGIGPFGQVIKGDFKLGLFGHIHSPMDITDELGRELRSIGTPYQISIADKSESIGLLTLDNGKYTFERISSSDPNHKYVRMYYDYEAPKSVRPLDIVIDTVDSTVNFNNPTINLEGKELNFSKVANIRDKRFIDSFISANFNQDILNVHKIITNKIDIIEQTNLKFKIKEFELWNFRSIEHCKFSFTSSKEVIFFNGTNGSGKSSIINGLIVGLLGDRNIYDWGRLGHENDVSTSVTLEYCGTLYNIVRGVGYTTFSKYVNDKWIEIPGKSKTSIENDIYETLPFLYYIEYFFIHPRTSFWGGIDRVKFFVDCFGLDIFNSYFSEASEYLKLTEQKLKNLNEKKLFLDSRVQAIKKELSNIDDRISTEFKDVVNLNQFEYKEKLDKINTSILRYKETKSKIDLLNSQIETISKLPTLDWFNTAITEEENISKKIEEYTPIYNQLSRDISSNRSKLNQKQIKCGKCGNMILLSGEDIDEIKNNISLLEKQLRDLGECPKHKYPINQLLADRGKVESLTGSIQLRDKLDSELKGLLPPEVLKSEQDSLNQIIIKMSNLNILKGIYATQMKNLEEVQVDLPNYDNSIITLTKEVEAIKQYIEIFNAKNENSIYRKTLDYIANCINTDTIKFSTFEILKSGNLKFNLDCSLKVDGNWIPYKKISDGQITAVDFNIMSGFINALGGVGLVVLDEALAYVSPDNYEKLENIIRNLNSNLVIITSQSPQLNCYDKYYTLIRDNGITKIIT